MVEPSSAELRRILGLLEERHGVGMRGAELPLWMGERLKRAVLALMAARRLSAAELLAALDAETELVVELANALRVGETRFYRDAAQWEALRQRVIPRLLQRREAPLLALSAGCSTGEETWTLAMLLAEARLRERERVRVRVLGVDRSEPALVTARAAVFDAGSARHVPRELAQRFLVPALDGSLHVVPELQRVTSFQGRDLMRGMPPGRYSIIVCKNVLIYFGGEAQARLVTDLLRALDEDGVLIVARSEVPLVRSLGGAAEELAPGITGFARG